MLITVRQTVIRTGLAVLATATLASAAVVGGQAARQDTCDSTATKALTMVDNLRHPFDAEPGCR